MLAPIVAFATLLLAAAQPSTSVASARPTPTSTRATTPLAPNASARTVEAAHATQAPVIDGRDDDALWKSVSKTSSFRQFSPKIDVDPSMQTEFQVAYDARNLYVFVRMHDAHPDSIMHALSRRDVRGLSDQIKLLIDSYDDKRTGYEFAVNPDGVKRDYAITNDHEEDESWNGIWDVATRVDRDGGIPHPALAVALRGWRSTHLRVRHLA